MRRYLRSLLRRWRVCGDGGGKNDSDVKLEGEGDVKKTDEEFQGSGEIGSGQELECGSAHSPDETDELPPMLNPVILDILFRVTPIKQLAKCRLVCKTWEESSRWRSTCTIPLLYLERRVTLSPSSSYSHPHGATTLGEFLNFLDGENTNCNAKPFRRFHLINWKCYEPTGKSLENPSSLKGQINRLWNLVGAHVEALTLTDCKFSSGAKLWQIILESCPNLKTLVLRSCTTRDGNHLWNHSNIMKYAEPVGGEQLKLNSLSVYISPRSPTNGEDWKSDFPVNYLELLSHFPSLTSLRITYDLDVAGVTDDAGMWMNAVKVIMAHDKRKLMLKNFQIDDCVWFTSQPKVQEYFNLFKEFNVSLKSVCFELSDPTADENKIKELISLHGKTLQKVEADENYGPVNRPMFGFPYGVQLDKLRVLKMRARFCQNMEFIKFTPNLEELAIYNSKKHLIHIVSNTLEHELENLQLVKLKKLGLKCRMSDDDLVLFAKLMPNIEELKIFLNDAQLGVVCEQWRRLVHLHVLDVGLTDAGIIGMGLGETISGKGITLLKGLKCLKIYHGHGLAGGDVCRLTDLSAANGFLELSQLEILHFHTTETWFGTATKRALCAKIPNCKLHHRHQKRVECPCCEGGVGVGSGMEVGEKLAMGITCKWK